MVPISIPDRAVIVCVGGRYDPLDALAKKAPGVVIRWNSHDPAPAQSVFEDYLQLHNRIVIAMQYANYKDVRAISKQAIRSGYSPILLSLPKAPVIDKGIRWMHQIHAIKTIVEVSFSDVRMPHDLRHETGSFDLIGDIHGCADELKDLLKKLGHMDDDGLYKAHPEKRRVVFLGDYVDRGPKNVEVLNLVMSYTNAGHFAVMGNHEEKLLRYLTGNLTKISSGIAVTIEELSETTQVWREVVIRWIRGLQPHMTMDEGNLIVAHAGLREDLHGQSCMEARKMALYGIPKNTAHDIDEDGYPIRLDWANDYKGKATVVHGHVVYGKPRVTNNVIAIDTGVVFGGDLTAYRYPEGTFVSVPARRAYFSKRTKDVIPPEPMVCDILPWMDKASLRACLESTTSKPKSANAIMRHAKVKDENIFWRLVNQFKLIRETDVWDGYILTDLGKRVKQELKVR